MTPRRRWVAGLVLALAAGAWSSSQWTLSARDLPSRLSNDDFWKLSEQLSEPGGSFRSDNLLSNEMVFARVVPELVSRTKLGGVYLGVGPEQNFTYIAAIKPRMAFIIDIRRGNLHLQLMYKALFELSADRAEFVSRLFTRKRPDGLTRQSTADEIFAAYATVAPGDEVAFRANLKAIHELLTKKRDFPLSEEDAAGIAQVYYAFHTYGPEISYSASVAGAAAGQQLTPRPASYAGLMSQVDQSTGQGLSYLGSEERFLVLKELQSRNMVVPVVGNFAGPKAIRAVGTYLKERGGVVTAFYLSNVEQYLQRENVWQAFCHNAATLPLDDASLFIRPSGGGAIRFVITRPDTIPGTVPVMPQTPYRASLFPILTEVKNCG